MISARWALVGLTLFTPVSMQAANAVRAPSAAAAKPAAKKAAATNKAPAKKPPAKKAAPKRQAAAAPAAVKAEPFVPDVAPSDAVLRVSDWVAQSKDNGPLPYAIIDKNAARLYLFNSKGEMRGDAAILLGIAAGDDASPGVGGKTLAALGPAEKTTPAGRFIAKYGVAAGGVKVLWVDYSTSVAIHPLVKGTKAERRAERLYSPETDDNRISFGCINVPPTFYAQKVRPFFRRKGGVVYILPDTKTMEDVFPRLHVFPFVSRANPAAPAAQEASAPSVQP
ncbi:hypothetical protein KFK14_08755 [Sphingobium phenoxybenzoativorans]|uniref:L,D-transpeptidase n=1 Tax=Sphingobium phenoxybenzoativorans TaxID=1592790 RepID=A0A975Q2X9_9SPHN|nr:hypothetical protein [Sphingobium phenoxybenzoativorans]QUT07465.1 hypothetical protein KFK14_08755 [Sphingobium phenoxybenzoativorans]